LLPCDRTAVIRAVNPPCVWRVNLVLLNIIPSKPGGWGLPELFLHLPQIF
jgi:hypothetical protein